MRLAAAEVGWSLLWLPLVLLPLLLSLLLVLLLVLLSLLLLRLPVYSGGRGAAEACWCCWGC